MSAAEPSQGANSARPGGSAAAQPQAGAVMTSITDKTVSLCTCNGTMPLDAEALGARGRHRGAASAHGHVPEGSRPSSRHAAGGDMIVGCTQEQRLLGEVADEAGSVRSIRFVNIRETAGWSAEAPRATPKIAALLAAAALPDPEPVASIGYQSEGQVLIVGPLDAALRWAETLTPALSVTVLATQTARDTELPAYARVSGRFGAAHAARRAGSARSTRSGRRKTRSTSTSARAATRALPRARSTRSRGISRSISIACKDHRACVAACGAVGAIDFDRRDNDARRALRRRARPAAAADGSRSTSHRRVISRPGADPLAQAKAAAELALSIGEFEKPKYFAYKPSICAHSRSRKTGCTQCIDVCSTLAIRADGDHVAGRAAPVHGLRRLHDRLPVRRADLRVSDRRRSRRADAHAARHVRAGRRPRCRPAPACRRCAAGPRVARAPRSRAAGADAAARSRAHRVGRHRLVDGRTGVGRHQRRRPRNGPRSAAIPRCAAIPDVDRADDRQRAGLPGRAFPPDRRERAGRRPHAGRNGQWRCRRALPRRSPPRTTSGDAGVRLRPPRAACAGAPNDDSAAGGRSVRIPRRGPRPLHDVPCVRRIVPGGRAARSRRDAQAAVHRDATACNAAFAPKRAPRMRSRSCRGWI